MIYNLWRWKYLFCQMLICCLKIWMFYKWLALTSYVCTGACIFSNLYDISLNKKKSHKITGTIEPIIIRFIVVCSNVCVFNLTWIEKRVKLIDFLWNQPCVHMSQNERGCMRVRIYSIISHENLKMKSNVWEWWWEMEMGMMIHTELIISIKYVSIDQLFEFYYCSFIVCMCTSFHCDDLVVERANARPHTLLNTTSFFKAHSHNCVFVRSDVFVLPQWIIDFPCRYFPLIIHAIYIHVRWRERKYHGTIWLRFGKRIRLIEWYWRTI